MRTLAYGVVWGLTAYLAIGLAFGIPFVLRGVQRIDPAARESGLGFRAIILPGVAALWPLLLARWVRGRAAPGERNAHRLASRGRRT